MLRDNEELEIKFELTGDELEEIRSNQTLEDLAVKKPITKTLHSIYFDTPDHSLRSQSISLRVRQVGKEWIQTIKSKIGVTAGVSHPVEFEVKVENSEPDLTSISDTSLRKKITKLTSKDALIPVFETVIRRTTRLLRAPDGSEIEIALDKGDILAGKRSAEIYEAELELKSGTVRSILTLAEALMGSKAMKLSKMSKAERGYRLVEESQAFADLKPQTSKKPNLKSRHTAEEALKHILQSVAGQVTHNLGVTRHSEVPEGAHQLRIGLRRLRAALRAYRPITDCEMVRWLGREARDLAQLVGEQRDIDVLISDIVMLASKNAPPDLGAEKVLKKLERHRQGIRSHVCRALRDKRWTMFELKLGMFIEMAGWRLDNNLKAEKVLRAPAHKYARTALNKSWRRAEKLGGRISELSISERHDLRKALKNLRYLVEFFSSLYPAKKVRPFLKQLKQAQNVFGYLNDVAMAEQLLHIFQDADGQLKDARLTTGYVLGWHMAEAENAWKDAVSRWKSLSKAERFWK